MDVSLSLSIVLSGGLFIFISTKKHHFICSFFLNLGFNIWELFNSHIKIHYIITFKNVANFFNLKRNYSRKGLGHNSEENIYIYQILRYCKQYVDATLFWHAAYLLLFAFNFCLKVIICKYSISGLWIHNST